MVVSEQVQIHVIIGVMLTVLLIHDTDAKSCKQCGVVPNIVEMLSQYREGQPNKGQETC
jgi:hypothetical protein